LSIQRLVNFGDRAVQILLTFLAGVEIDIAIVRRNFWSTMSIGLMGFFAPYLGILFFARFIYHWSWAQAQISGIALSTTSVAVVYAVMVETGFNKTEIGKIILAACFINDLGTLLALGLVFANYNMWLLTFAAVTVAVMIVLPKVVPPKWCLGSSKELALASASWRSS
jgi:Kef-type K+ transport system membrane component KefB